ncbi:MAG: hypothetical protein M1812_001677, partial [Candelaria pacifica]
DQIEQRTTNDHPSFRQICQADNGACYYKEPSKRECEEDGALQAQQGNEKQKQKGIVGVAWYAKDTGDRNEEAGRLVALHRGVDANSQSSSFTFDDNR